MLRHAPTGFRQSIQSHDWQTLNFIEFGRGKPIIFLHGFGMEASQWLPFALSLGKTNRVLIPDLRGFGGSHLARYTQACVLTDFANDLEALLKLKLIERAKLVGISMGALTALKYLELYGDRRIESYLHIDQSPKCLNSKDWSCGLYGEQQTWRLKKARQLMKDLDTHIQDKTPFSQLPKPLKKRLCAEFGEFFSTALSKDWHKSVATKFCANRYLFEKLVRTENWPAYAHCFNAYIEQDYDLRSTLNQTDVAIEVIVGMKSEMYPPAGQLRIGDYARRCRINAYTNSGHTPLIDQPIKLAKDIKRFATEILP